jgi:hypothetical protein
MTPNGWARCTRAPPSCNTSTAQYQPYVASRTTSGGLAGLGQLLSQRDRVVAAR